MKEKLAKLGIAALAFMAIAAPTTFFANANAQESPSAQGNPPAAGPQGGFGNGNFRNQGPGQGPGGQGRPMMGMGGMGGGGGAIAVDGTGVYVLQGNKVYKLDKGSLKVTQQADLPIQRPPQGMPGGPGGPGGPPDGGNDGGAENTK